MDSPTGPECEETLVLLALYGPRGSRYEDTRVLDMIEDKFIPREQPYKSFLKLLRTINSDWLKDHPEDAKSDIEFQSECSESHVNE